jgi:predicted alpha/beta-fold hydrolase
MKHTGKLTDTPTKINTRFFAYTPQEMTTAHEIHPKDTASHSIVTHEKPVAIIAHGFTNNGQTPDLLTLKTSLLKSGHVFTVIITDWEKGAASPWYTEASVNTQVVGRQIANLVNHLKTSRSIDPANVYLFGYSLGAQVSGFAGKFSQSEYNWKFGRITGELCF